jgi:hypothetical protein
LVCLSSIHLHDFGATAENAAALLNLQLPPLYDADYASRYGALAATMELNPTT